MKRNILRDCLRIAKEKLPRHPQFEFYPHYSFIIQNNKLIEWAFNTSDNPPIHFGYETRINNGKAKTHAEFNAWRRARGVMSQVEAFECVNIRLNRQGRIKMSAPCSCCYGFLHELGCTTCYFTTDAGEWDSYSLDGSLKMQSILV